MKQKLDVFFSKKQIKKKELLHIFHFGNIYARNINFEIEIFDPSTYQEGISKIHIKLS